MLEEERAYFDDHLEEWLESHAGKFALVKGAELVGVFDDLDGALAAGARQFGLESFLVRPIATEQEKVVIPALALGLLGANPP